MKPFYPVNFSFRTVSAGMMSTRPQLPRFAGSDSEAYSPMHTESEGDSYQVTLPIRKKKKRVRQVSPSLEAYSSEGQYSSKPHKKKRSHKDSSEIEPGSIFLPGAEASVESHLDRALTIDPLDETTTQVVCKSPLPGADNDIQIVVIRHINGPNPSDRSRFPLRDWRYPVHVMEEFADDQDPTRCHPLVREHSDEALFKLSDDSKALMRELYKPKSEVEQAIAELETNCTELLRRKIMGLPNDYIGHEVRPIKKTDVPKTEHHKVGTWGLFALYNPDKPLPTLQNCHILDFYDGALLLNEQQKMYHEKSYGLKYRHYRLAVGTETFRPDAFIASYGGGNDMQFANMSVAAHRDETKLYGYRLEPNRNKTNADYITGTITLPNKHGDTVSYPVGGIMAHGRLKPGQEICPDYGPDHMPYLEELYFGPPEDPDAVPYIQRPRSASPALSQVSLQRKAATSSSGFAPPLGPMPRHISAAYSILDRICDRLNTGQETRNALRTIVQWPEVDKKSLTGLLKLYESYMPAGTFVPPRSTVAKHVGEYNRLRSGMMPHIGLPAGHKESDIPKEHKDGFLRYYNESPDDRKKTIKEFIQGYEGQSNFQMPYFTAQKLILSAPIDKLSREKVPPKLGEQHDDQEAFRKFVRENRYYKFLLKEQLPISVFYDWFKEANPTSSLTTRMADYSRKKLFDEVGRASKQKTISSKASENEAGSSELSEPPSDFEKDNPFTSSNSQSNKKKARAGSLTLAQEKTQLSQWANQYPELPPKYQFQLWKATHPNTKLDRTGAAKVLPGLVQPGESRGAAANAIRFVDTVTNPDDPFWNSKLDKLGRPALKALYNEKYPQYKVSLNTSTILEVNKAIEKNNANPAKPHIGIGSGVLTGNKTDPNIQSRILEHVLENGKNKSALELEQELRKASLNTSAGTIRRWAIQLDDGSWTLKAETKKEFPELCEKYGIAQEEQTEVKTLDRRALANQKQRSPKQAIVKAYIQKEESHTITRLDELATAVDVPKGTLFKWVKRDEQQGRWIWIGRG